MNSSTGIGFVCWLTQKSFVHKILNRGKVWKLAGVQFILSSLDRIQRRLLGLVGDELFHTLPPLSYRLNVSSVSPFCRCFGGKCSDELHSFVPPIQAVPARTHPSSYAASNHPYRRRIPFVRKKLHSNSSFLRFVTLWNKLPRRWFHNI